MKKTILILSTVITAYIVHADPAALKLRNESIALLRKDEFRQAEKTLLKAINIELKKYGARSSQVAKSQLIHAEIMFYRGKYEYAINTAKSSLNILGRIHGANSLEASKAGYVLAKLFLSTGQVILAEATIRKTLSIQISKAPVAPETMDSRIVLAEILCLKDKTKAALSTLQKAQRAIKQDSPLHAQYMIGLSKAYRNNGKLDKAHKTALKAIEICDKVYGKDSLNNALATENLVQVLSKEKKFKEAQKLFPGIAKTFIKKVGVRHLYTIELMMLRGYVYMREGDQKKSKALLSKATEAMQHILPGKNMKTALCMYYSAKLNSAQKKYAAAEVLFKYAIKTFIKQLGTNNTMVASCLNELSIIAASKSQLTKAVKYALRMKQIYVDLKGPDDPLVASAWRNLAFMYTRSMQPNKAIKAYNSALKIYKKKPDPKNDMVVARIYADMAALYGRINKPAEAKSHCLKALAICKKYPNIKDKNKSMIYYLCSFYFYSIKDFKKAHELISKAKNILEKKYGPRHPTIQHYNKAIQMIKKQM